MEGVAVVLFVKLGYLISVESKCGICEVLRIVD